LKRTPVAHVIFPRASTLRPVPEFSWDAIDWLASCRGLDVEVIMPVPADWARSLHGRVRGLRGAAAWPTDLEGALTALQPRPTLVPYVPVPGRSIESATLAIAARLVARPRVGRPALIHGSFLDEGGYSATQIAKAVGCPSIVVSHGSDARAAAQEVGSDAGRTRRSRSALRDATEVIAVSHELSAKIARLGRRAEVMPFTSHPERFALQPRPQGRRTVLFVGRKSRAKGVDVLLEAFAAVNTSDVVLELVGPACSDIDVAAEARRLGISERIIDTDELPRDALVEVYGRASCLVLPSRAEGLPCVVVEALLSGRPAIVTDVGGMREIIDEHTGQVVPVGDHAALATSIDNVLHELARGRWAPDALRSRALPLSWSAVGPRLETLTWRLITCAFSS
jgi:glycosyltransferase involved in cell wall biosynthesis